MERTINKDMLVSIVRAIRGVIPARYARGARPLARSPDPNRAAGDEGKLPKREIGEHGGVSKNHNNDIILDNIDDLYLTPIPSPTCVYAMP